MSKDFDVKRQHKLAVKFHALHHGKETLVLPNAWDAVSAKIFEKADFPAIATTSSGISWTTGYQDGEIIPPELMTAVVSRIARVIDIPVTADIEGGYFHQDLNQFSEYIKSIIKAGAVGINLEDTHLNPTELNNLEHQQTKIKAAKKAGEDLGVNLFINARTDTMTLKHKSLDEKIQLSIDRAKAFEKAGADGIFVPFIKDIEIVKQLKTGIHLRLNILIAESLDVDELKNIGVNRISIGGRIKLKTLPIIQSIAEELKNGDDWSSLFTEGPTHPELNSWFE